MYGPVHEILTGAHERIQRSAFGKDSKVGECQCDALNKLISQKEETLLGVIPLEVQRQPSIPSIEVATVEATAEVSWVTPIVDYITKGTLPVDKEEAWRLKYKAAQYVMYDGTLYKRGFNKPLLWCISGKQCEHIIAEIHEGICENHSGGTFLTYKIFRQGYYWPSLQEYCHRYT